MYIWWVSFIGQTLIQFTLQKLTYWQLYKILVNHLSTNTEVKTCHVVPFRLTSSGGSPVGPRREKRSSLLYTGSNPYYDQPPQRFELERPVIHTSIFINHNYWERFVSRPNQKALQQIPITYTHSNTSINTGISVVALRLPSVTNYKNPYNFYNLKVIGIKNIRILLELLNAAVGPHNYETMRETISCLQRMEMDMVEQRVHQSKHRMKRQTKNN